MCMVSTASLLIERGPVEELGGYLRTNVLPHQCHDVLHGFVHKHLRCIHSKSGMERCFVGFLQPGDRTGLTPLPALIRPLIIPLHADFERTFYRDFDESRDQVSGKVSIDPLRCSRIEYDRHAMGHQFRPINAKAR